MSSSPLIQTVGELVRENPARSRVFEHFSIDYCCGGKVPLREACRERGLDADRVAADLALVDAEPAPSTEDPASMGLAALADHIEATHHAYLREELPRLDFMTKKVAQVHGDAEPRLHEIRQVFVTCREELEAHMLKEERVLFPMIRELEQADGAVAFHCGSLANPIEMMEHEHDSAGHAMSRFKELTDGYAPPEWACNTYRAMVDGLAAFERDMHQHVHKENNVLFPRALELEASRPPKGGS
ncbi:MAG: iron-sulfur cluster repair di-iron protein [Planctomycetota bacterium]|nr:MAG: iron-sulfur cluster repair di-iron protein [Planctomycetota bacterium]